MQHELPHSRLLLVAGAFFFLFGLLQGIAVDVFVNPRMGLSAHLAAVQSGMALMIAAFALPLTSLKPRVSSLCAQLLTWGMYGIWIAITLGASTGASRALPIAGFGREASEWAEVAVLLLVLTSGFVALIGWTVLCYGLVRRPAAKTS